MKFTGQWWPFQEAVLDAFKRDVATGERQTSVIAPPGSGKTLLGLEMLARSRKRMLASYSIVLVPNTAIQAQWVAEHHAHFTYPETIQAYTPTDDAPLPKPGILVMTYQSVARFASDNDAIEALVDEDLAASGRPAASRSDVRRRVRRELAREDPSSLLKLLHPSVQALLEHVGRDGALTLVADECHHAASMWGYVMEAIAVCGKAERVIGLTATRPAGRAAAEEQLYARLFGDVDIEVATPAIVREGRLAPYQELAYFVRPLETELAWLQTRDRAFTQLVTDLHADASSPLSIPAWALTTLRESARIKELKESDPDLVDVLVAFAQGADIDVPRGIIDENIVAIAELRPEHWARLLGAWAHDMAKAKDVSESDLEDLLVSIQSALDPLGFRVTKRGMRRTRAQADRVVCQSAAKALGAMDVLAHEARLRGASVRAVILCDSEVSGADADELRSVLDPASGSARYLHAAACADSRTATLRPLIVSGRNLRVHESDAADIVAALAAAAGLPEKTLSCTEPDEAGVVEVRGPADLWAPRVWIPAATELLRRGQTGAIFSTRAMLGEGWDAPCVNVLIDCTASSTETTAVQVRGRSLRLDDGDPDKVATNWDIVCVEPSVLGGDRDYLRCAAKHEWLLAPCEDGTIERGIGHIHPALPPSHPPTLEQLTAINRFALNRANELDVVRQRWKIGEGYQAIERLVLTMGEPAARALDDEGWWRAVEALCTGNPKALSEAVWDPGQRRRLRVAYRLPLARERGPAGSHVATRLGAVFVLLFAPAAAAWISLSAGMAFAGFGTLLLVIGFAVFFWHKKTRSQEHLVSGLTLSRLIGAGIAITAAYALGFPLAAYFESRFSDLGVLVSAILVLGTGITLMFYVAAVIAIALVRVLRAAWISAIYDVPHLIRTTGDVVRVGDEFGSGAAPGRLATKLIRGALTKRPPVPVDLLALWVLGCHLRQGNVTIGDVIGTRWDARGGYIRFHAPNLRSNARAVLEDIATLVGPLTRSNRSRIVRPVPSEKQPPAFRLVQHTLPASSPTNADDSPQALPIGPPTTNALGLWLQLFSHPTVEPGDPLTNESAPLRDFSRREAAEQIDNSPRVTQTFIRSTWT